MPNALDRYKFDVGHYPTEEEGGLKALVVKPNFKDEAMGRNWQGPYLKAEPLDAWGRPIRYQPRAAGDSPTQGHSEYRLWSAGPDGKDGTEDDIRNWRE